jgi:hypothetical protein
MSISMAFMGKYSAFVVEVEELKKVVSAMMLHIVELEERLTEIEQKRGPGRPRKSEE